MRFQRSSRLLAIASIAYLASFTAAQATTSATTTSTDQSASAPAPPASNQQAGTAPPASQGSSVPPAPEGQGCVSYGIDFQNNGTYFINSASDDFFTAVNQFKGPFDQSNFSITLTVR
jgi:hypothetical protein